MALTYTQYLKLDELLNLQKVLSVNEHDETLFIIIHQVYELWFKQVIHELHYLQQKFTAAETPQILATLKRVLTIFKIMVEQIDILETMSPQSFLSFRDRLETASGFQSRQFRQLEILLGKRSRLTPEVRALLADELKKPSVYDSFFAYLKAKNHAIPDTIIHRDVSEQYMENPAIQQVLLDVYKNNPLDAQICERLVDLDEGLQEWRYRHVKMVERTIGVRTGTGGSSGAEYLRSTLFQPLFPELWTIRVRF